MISVIFCLCYLFIFSNIADACFKLIKKMVLIRFLLSRNEAIVLFILLFCQFKYLLYFFLALFWFPLPFDRNINLLSYGMFCFLYQLISRCACLQRCFSLKNAEQKMLTQRVERNCRVTVKEVFISHYAGCYLILLYVIVIAI